jgi:hypothetical protein
MTEIPRPVAELIEAANANDTDAFLASLTGDAVVDDWGASSRDSRRSAAGATASSSASRCRST